MDRDDFLRESVRGTLAFARLGILLVFLMNLAGYLGEPNRAYAAGMVLSALAAGLAYLAQMAASFLAAGGDLSVSAAQAGRALQIGSAAAASAGVLAFIVGY